MTLLASAIARANDHGYEAGRYVAQHALAAFQKPPALFIVSISNQYNEAEVVRGIRSITTSVPLIGSSSGGVVTMAGLMPKGVGVLALRSDEMQTRLALTSGVESQPAAAAERAMQKFGDLAAPPAGHHDTLLVLTAGEAAGSAIAAVSQAVQSRGVSAGTLVGAAGKTSSARVFLDDETAVDSLAVGLLRTPTPVGSGIGHNAHTALRDAAQDAARQAMAALGDHTPVAALVLASSEITPDIEGMRDVVGRTTPLVGISGLGGVTTEMGTDKLHTNAVLVYVIGRV
jgi:hypothetical protein